MPSMPESGKPTAEPPAPSGAWALVREFFRELFDFQFTTFMATRMLPVVYGFGIVLAALFTGYVVFLRFRESANEGLAWLAIGPLMFFGLVTHLAADPVDAAHKLAAEFETRSPDAVAAAKFLMQDAFGHSESGALAAERRWQRRLLGTRNQRIAVARNLEKKDLPFGPRRIGA